MTDPRPKSAQDLELKAVNKVWQLLQDMKREAVNSADGNVYQGLIDGMRDTFECWDFKRCGGCNEWKREGDDYYSRQNDACIECIDGDRPDETREEREAVFYNNVGGRYGR